jgi:hypothetical protein
MIKGNTVINSIQKEKFIILSKNRDSLNFLDRTMPDRRKLDKMVFEAINLTKEE